MTTTSSIPYFVWMFVYILVAGVIATHWPFFAREQPTWRRDYNVPLEGVRGLLALSVWLFHVAVIYVYFRTGEFGHVARLYEHMGSSAVLLFFFLTGFLFWNKSLRSGTPRALPFYAARAWRICPAYCLALVLVVLLTAARSRFHLQEGAGQVAGEVARWCAFGFLGFPEINGVPKVVLTNSGVFWTLKWEWVFYLLLPLLGWFATGRRVIWVASLLLVEALISHAMNRHGGMARVFLTGFYPGMLAAHAVRSPIVAWITKQRWSPLVPVVALGVTLTFIPAESLWVVPPLWIAFVSVAAGEDVFGLLRRRELLLLGQISYSTYLLHGSVLFVGSYLINRFVPIGTMSPFVFWAILGPLGILVVLISAASFQFVEHPFLVRRHALAVQTIAAATEPQESLEAQRA